MAIKIFDPERPPFVTRFGFWCPVPGLDFYGCVKLVNFVRSKIDTALEEHHHSLKAAAASIETAAISSQGSAFADDR